MALRPDILCRPEVERALAGPLAPPWAEPFANHTLKPGVTATCRAGVIRVIVHYADGTDAEYEAEHPGLLGFAPRTYVLRRLRGTGMILSPTWAPVEPDPADPLKGMPGQWRLWLDSPAFPDVQVNIPQIPWQPPVERLQPPKRRPGDLGRGFSGPGGAFGEGEVSLEDLLRRLGGGQDGQRLDLSGLIAVLVHGLGVADRIRGALTTVAPDLTKGLAPEIANLAALLQGVSPELTAGLGLPLGAISRAIGTAAAERTRLQLTNDQVEGEKNRGALGGIAEAFWDQFADTLEPLVKRALAVFQSVFQFMGDKVQNVGELLVGQIGAVYRDALEARAPVTAANVSGVAGEALKNALAAGLAAQTAALILELAHPLKRLGLNQVVGFIADFAGFSQVAGAFTGPSLRWGLQRPADFRAASVFRTNLPSPGEALEQAYQRHISLQDYAHILALHGFPSWWIKVVVDDTFVDPRARELSQLLEDSEADPVWLAMKLREVGWDDGDVEKGVTALLLRSTQPGRSRVIGAAMREYARGRITGPELERHLAAAALREEHKALWLRAARLERRGDLMEDLGTRVVKQYREEVTTREAAAAELTGLGFAPEEVRARLLAADLDRQVKQLREEAQDVEVHVRQIRTTALTNLRQQFRAGFVDRDTLLTWGEALGFKTSYLENVADLEELKGPPSDVEALPIMGLGAVQKAASEAARLLKDEVRQGRVTALTAVEILAGFGVSRETGRDLFRVAEVLGLPVPGSLGIPLADGRGGRPGWEAVLAEVLGEIHRGRAGRNLLREASTILGIPTEHTAGREAWLALLEDLIRGR